MTNEKALETLLDNAENGYVDIEEVKLVFAEMQSNSDEDCISRQAVLDCIRDNYRRWFISDDAFMQCVNEIKNIAPVTPQPKTRHWINVEDRTDWYDATYKCSCCGREVITPYKLKHNLYSDYPYCHCGAKMIEQQKSEDKK